MTTTATAELPPIESIDDFLMGFVDAKMGWGKRNNMGFSKDYRNGYSEGTHE